jgi:predicted  nucleic acid-binding Zn-ribbon protein
MTAEQAVEATPQVEASREVDRIRDIILGPQLRDYEQRFKIIQRDLERLQQEFDHLTEQLANQDSEQGKKLQTLRREMRQGDDDLRGELRQTGQKLTTDKVDRMALGELFIELGEHLKAGGSLADLLKGLGDTTK